MLKRMALCVVTIVMSVQLYFWQLFDVCVCVCVCIIIHPSKLLVNVANFKNFVKLKKKKCQFFIAHFIHHLNSVL